MHSNKTIAICGAGIAGAATAYYLLKKRPDLKVVLIDKNQPLSFTTSKSGENFRDYWPQTVMQQYVSHSIDLMETLRQEHGATAFNMVYSGYNFISHQDQAIFGVSDKGRFIKGMEEINSSEEISNNYPYLDSRIRKILRIKKAGNIDVYAMGSLLLREARKKGLQQVQGKIVAMEKKATQFQIKLDSKKTILADKVVIATGPFINHLAAMLGFQFPITNTLQRKFIIPDPQNVIPRNMPFTIYADGQSLDWSAEEKTFFASEEKYNWLLAKFPGGLHIKPEGQGIKMGWAFQTKTVTPTWDYANLELFPQVVLKGASRFIPQLAIYEKNIPTPLIEYAGYYTRTKENWPLIGPTEMEDVFVVGALAGYGTMGACAAGELCTQYLCQETTLPTYAAYFHPARYQNPAIRAEIAALKSDGQL